MSFVVGFRALVFAQFECSLSCVSFCVGTDFAKHSMYLLYLILYFLFACWPNIRYQGIFCEKASQDTYLMQIDASLISSGMLRSLNLKHYFYLPFYLLIIKELPLNLYQNLRIVSIIFHNMIQLLMCIHKKLNVLAFIV